MPRQQVQRPRQRIGRGFVPRDEDRHRLFAQLLVGHRFARLFVLRVHQQRQQVARILARTPPLGHHAQHDAVQGLGGLQELVANTDELRTFAVCLDDDARALAGARTWATPEGSGRLMGGGNSTALRTSCRSRQSVQFSLKCRHSRCFRGRCGCVVVPLMAANAVALGKVGEEGLGLPDPTCRERIQGLVSARHTLRWQVHGLVFANHTLRWWIRGGFFARGGRIGRSAPAQTCRGLDTPATHPRSHRTPCRPGAKVFSSGSCAAGCDNT